MAPQAGMIPVSDGPVGSGLVAMNRDPARMRRMACVICPRENALLSPRTTYSGSLFVSVYPTACMALVSPASPITKAVDFGRCDARNWDVAIADVNRFSSGLLIPSDASRCDRSRGVYMRLLVMTRKGVGV